MAVTPRPVRRVTIPAQNVAIQTPTGIDPVWYEKMKILERIANLFSELDPNNIPNGYVLIWDATKKTFTVGPN